MSELSNTVIQSAQLSETAFDNIMLELLKQTLDKPIPLSLLVYTDNTKDIGLILDMHHSEVDSLHYFVQEVDTSSPPSNEQDVKPPIIMVRRELATGCKRLVKTFISFHKHLRQEIIEVFADWSNISLEMFNHYRQYIHDVNVTTPAPSRLVKPESKQETTRSNNSYQQSPVDQFKKSIKRDKSDFTVLKDKKQFKSWHQNLIAVASAQDVEEF